MTGGGGPGVHQFVPMLHVGDAVGRHTASVQALLRGRGVPSEVYVELEDPGTAHATRRAADYPSHARDGDVLVYQLATASDLAAWLADRPEALVVDYHNVTPPELVASWDNSLARHQVAAQQQVAALAPRAVLAVADSEFNRADLVAAGYRQTAVVPPVVPLPEPGTAVPSPAPDPAAGLRWLAVGRLAPNKSVEDVVTALACARQGVGPADTLEVVGRPTLDRYTDALHRWAAELGVAEAVRFAGSVEDEALDRAYRAADVLVVLSQHEGFCLPVVEAMARGLPVVALRRGSLEEVMGPELDAAGALLDEAEPEAVAAAVHRVAGDPAVRAAVTAAGRARLGQLDLATAGDRLVDLLMAVRQGAAVPTPG